MIGIELVTLGIMMLCANDDVQVTEKRLYTHLLAPQEHPDYNRRHVRPPTWETFGNRTQFTSLRGFGEKDGNLVNYEQEMDRYTRIDELGDVLWPAYPVIFAKNLSDLADEIKRRGLFLFDVWGFVPGSGPGGYWQQFKPPDCVFDLLESKLGEHWLGMDVGEQDGRYIGGYAPQIVPSSFPRVTEEQTSASRFQQYMYFQRHFQRMCDELGNKMSTLVSLNFGHYFLKEGVYTLIGAETAQGLPNGQVYYAFIRGAGKQYGVPWFGNVSVFNRWGYKTYGSEGDDHSPTKGTSLSLMKRLMVSHILYNCVLVGFESGWFDGDKLSPIGQLQKETRQWVQEHDQPGVMQTPIALMLDFFSGWSFPRHLYTGDIYRVWGNLPYDNGDYLTDGILDMLYPGYQDSSYFHNESGFITPTPYGDVADCILSDAESWLLNRYPVIVIASEMSGGLELRENLQAYIEQGGVLVITSGNLAKLPDGLAGVQVDADRIACESGSKILFGTEKLTEEVPFELATLKLPENARILATCCEMPIAAEVIYGKGQIIVLASPFGITKEPVIKAPVSSEIDKPLPKPYPILKHVRAILDKVFQSHTLFEVGEGLSWIVCRKGVGEYTLGICNNSLQECPFNIISRIGNIKSIQELPLARSEKQAVGYLPGGFEGSEIGVSGENTIAGGDIRVFAVKVQEQNVEEIPHVAPSPRRKGRILPLSEIHSIKEAILARPTFFEHFDSVLIDWRYLHEKEKKALQEESGWIQRQGLRILVDLTSGINLYPDLRLLNNLEDDYNASMEIVRELLEKMVVLNARDLILSLHRFPENNFTGEESWKSFEETLRLICADAEKDGINVYLRMCQGKPPWNLQEAAQFINRVGAKNLHLAPSIGLLLAQKVNPADIAGLIREKVGLWLVSTPAFDIGGHLWNINAPLTSGDWGAKIAEFISLAPNVPINLDAVYNNWDEVYQDMQVLGN
jgi:hypothetical protein